MFEFKFPALFTYHIIQFISPTSSKKREEIKSQADVFVYKQYSYHKSVKDHNSFKC